MSSEFIGCTLVDVSVNKLYEILVGSSDVGETDASALVRWDDLGTVVVATKWDPAVATMSAYVTDRNLDLGVTSDIYKQMRSLVDYSKPWDQAEVKALYRQTTFYQNDKLIMMHPVPDIPKEYDPLYLPGK